MQVRAGLGEGAVADAAHQADGVRQTAEEGVEMALLRRPPHAQQAGHKRGQRQLALPCEGARAVRMSRALREGVRMQGVGQFQQQGLDGGGDSSSYCEMNSENAMISTAYGCV